MLEFVFPLGHGEGCDAIAADVGTAFLMNSSIRVARRASLRTRYSITAAFRMQTIVAEAGFCDTLRIVCGRSER